MKGPAVCCDHQRRTCLLLSIDAESARFIPFAIEGFDVVEMDAKEFSKQYHPLGDYPPNRCAELYASYARNLGASPEAMTAFGQFTTLTKKEIDMATAKKSAAAAAKEKAPVKAPVKAAEKKAPVKAAAKKAPTTDKPTATKRRTAATAFQELIMEGKLTDEQIFAQVQSEFGLDDSKKGYVKWYRNYLAKQGKNPPAAKE